MHEEIEFETVEEQGHIPALHKKNALLRTPFTWEEEAEDL